MGYIRNHAIVVEASYGDYLERAHEYAKTIFPWVSPISEKAVNGSQSFFIPPDGSKEGWQASDIGDINRATFKKWLREQEDEDGRSSLNWAELLFGGDDCDAEICDHGDKRRVKEE
jgi:hypothetical protein